MKKSKAEAKVQDAKKPVKKSLHKKIRTGMKVLGVGLAAGIALVAAGERLSKDDECPENEKCDDAKDVESEYFYNK